MNEIEEEYSQQQSDDLKQEARDLTMLFYDLIEIDHKAVLTKNDFVEKISKNEEVFQIFNLFQYNQDDQN